MERKFTNREWANLGHALACFYYAYLDVTLPPGALTNLSGIASLADSYETFKYVLTISPDVLIRRADSYFGDKSSDVIEFIESGELFAIDWKGVVHDFYNEE